jgi:hypothetical protein
MLVDHTGAALQWKGHSSRLQWTLPETIFRPCSCPSGVNFNNVLRAAFTNADPKSVAILLSCQYLFTLLGSESIKATRRTLMKLTPVVNFTHILRAAFALIFFCQKITSQTVIREKMRKNTFIQKSPL